MSRIGDIVLQIEERIADGLCDTEISVKLGIPIDWVVTQRELFESQDMNLEDAV